MQARNPIDRRRTLTPRAYLIEPALFGTSAPVTFHTSRGGDDISQHAAATLHRLAVQARRRGINGAAIARKWGISRQTWSDFITGRHWPAMTTVVALTTELLEPATDQRNATR